MSYSETSSFRDTAAATASEEFDKSSKLREHDGSEEAPQGYNEQSIPMVVKSTSKSFGVRRTEILVEQFTHPAFRIFFLFTIFLCAYAYSLDGTVRNVYQTYATNSYGQHSLLATVNVIKGVIGAAAQPTYARLSDIFGRLELFIFAVILYAMGTVIESQAYDVYRFAGGTVLYQAGYSGVMLILQVILADFSNLNWRLFCSLVPAMPFIINTWISGDVTQASLDSYSWNFCIGMWAFIFPLACIPFVGCLVAMQWKGSKTDEWKQIRAEEKEVLKWRSWKDNMFVDLFWRIDVIGVLLIIIILGFILVPLTLGGGITDKWHEAYVIAPLVIGFVLIGPFIIWEYKFSKFPVFPFALMKDRGVWSALVIAILIDFVWYMPNDYMYTVLTAGMRASIKAATRITSLYSFVSTITGVLFGLLVVPWVRRLKPFIMFSGFCWMASLAILYAYRGGSDGVESEKYLNGVIGGLCLMGFGAGLFTYPTQVSIETCTNHEHMAIVISLYLSFYNIGLSIGSCVSGAVWTNTAFKYLTDKFQEAGLDSSYAELAYSEPLDFVAQFAWGSPERIAVALAYAQTQRLLCIIGLCLTFILIAFSFFLRDHKLESVQSLELAHEEGIKAEDGEVVVNDYDKDLTFTKLKSLFRRKEKNNAI
ncbi:unnamed protein product [Debaryomyces tyrocola]|nr:unnamed protein product [Debaryomyces tyrocola]